MLGSLNWTLGELILPRRVFSTNGERSSDTAFGLEEAGGPGRSIRSTTASTSGACTSWLRCQDGIDSQVEVSTVDRWPC
jgi:hypothetical protein